MRLRVLRGGVRQVRQNSPRDVEEEQCGKEEYAKAIHDAPSSGAKAEYLQKFALTWVREKKWAEADKAYRDAAQKAHAMEQWVWEARAYRMMAMYQPDQAVANQYLDQADVLLMAKKDALSKTDLDEEHARILRVRVERNLPAIPKSAAISPASPARPTCRFRSRFSRARRL